METQTELHKCHCGEHAAVYAMDPMPNGWADYYCLNHVPSGWQITDRLTESTDNQTWTCKHCDCRLHITSTITGHTYWASNSGNPYCTWPMGHMKHEAKGA